MLTKKTIIGIVAGSAFCALAIFLLIDSFGLKTVDENAIVVIGDSEKYIFNSYSMGEQKMKITGEKFDLKIEHSVDGEILPLTTYEKEFSLEWIHVSDGQSFIEIQNIGQSDLEIDATFQLSTDPIWIPFHIMVIITGMVIIGLSAGFSTRKPKGF